MDKGKKGNEMTEQKIIEFFSSHGFRCENNVFVGTHNYAFLPFNNSLIVGKISAKGLLVEGIFKDSWIRKISMGKGQVLIDIRDDIKLPLKPASKPLESADA